MTVRKSYISMSREGVCGSIKCRFRNRFISLSIEIAAYLHSTMRNKWQDSLQIC